MTQLSIRPGSTFQLNADVCLEATTALDVTLPAGILTGNARFGDLVRLFRDDVDVGVREDAAGKLLGFVLFLRSGDRFSLGRASEVYVKSADGKPAIFNVVN